MTSLFLNLVQVVPSKDSSLSFLVLNSEQMQLHLSKPHGRLQVNHPRQRVLVSFLHKQKHAARSNKTELAAPHFAPKLLSENYKDYEHPIDIEQVRAVHRCNLSTYKLLMTPLLCNFATHLAKLLYHYSTTGCTCFPACLFEAF